MFHIKSDRPFFNEIFLRDTSRSKYKSFEVEWEKQINVFSFPSSVTIIYGTFLKLQKHILPKSEIIYRLQDLKHRLKKRNFHEF